MPRKLPTPVKIRRLLASMSGGQRIVLTLSGEERTYCYERTGRPVGSWAFNRAKDMGLIEPVGDGLFPEAESQTWRLAP